MDTFTVRDLRERTGKLIGDAESGELSLITKHGRPVFVALPFDETLIQSGVLLSLAIKLYQDEVLSLEKAAKLAGIGVAQFTEELARHGLAAARYPADELEDELAIFD
ncbi:MAG TPA: type II toxin-antitoxin system prevent-host-death family antitoxin [Gammaproteobacteria bacterium]|nr:type II toxin-antitoxin system prevent-host-death family antitoxin [Gammaproteobacteria bacterium]